MVSMVYTKIIWFGIRISRLWFVRSCVRLLRSEHKSLDKCCFIAYSIGSTSCVCWGKRAETTDEENIEFYHKCLAVAAYTFYCLIYWISRYIDIILQSIIIRYLPNQSKSNGLPYYYIRTGFRVYTLLAVDYYNALM